jgi:hypothetical protein
MIAIVITAFALVYIQMQVTVYDLAYQGKVKEERIFKLVDSNTHKALRIAKLKSAQSLGDWFFHKNNDVDFINQNNIVRVQTPAGNVASTRLASFSRDDRGFIGLLARVFSLKSIAEAEPIR